MKHKEQIERTIKNLKKNNFNAFFFERQDYAVADILEKLRGAKSISRGGSLTVETIDLISKIRGINLPFRDYISKEDRLASLSAEYYLTSSNAITEDGKLVNVDGSGNRVAAMSFGPKHVFIVAGVNKLVKDEKAAIERIRNIAAPMNAKRLNKKTPCVKTGKCEDCSSEERICRKRLVLDRPEKDRISIFLINEELGF